MEEDVTLLVHIKVILADHDYNTQEITWLSINYLCLKWRICKTVTYVIHMYITRYGSVNIMDWGSVGLWFETQTYILCKFFFEFFLHTSLTHQRFDDVERATEYGWSRPTNCYCLTKKFCFTSFYAQPISSEMHALYNVKCLMFPALFTWQKWKILLCL